MSIVTIQLGQCGNQVGYDLFSTLVQDCQLTSKTQGWPADSYSNACLDMFFTTTSDKTAVPRAKAVLVDMESKVISKVTANATKSRQWCYDSSRSVCRSSGSGNNWAAGFYVNGPSMAEPVLEAVRKEVEACDHFEGFIALLSLAGGTGSGVGTYITQCLRDHYPNCMLLGQVVWPYENGEVIVQNYNSLLTLSNLYRNADIILAMDNDTLHRICFQRLAISKVSFSDMNRILGHKLASILQPVYSDSGSSKFIRNHLAMLTEQMSPHPDYKLLTVRNIPITSASTMEFSSYQWPGLMKHLRQMLVADALLDEGINWQIKPTDAASNKSLCNLLMCRGADSNTVDTSAFKSPQLYSRLLPAELAFRCLHQSRMFDGYEKSAALVSNSQSPVKLLDHVVGKAWTMFGSRAYVNQYLRHGMEEENFLDCFASLEQIIANYKHLSSL